MNLFTILNIGCNSPVSELGLYWRSNQIYI